jgi:triacylglycerol esterase/lipase EstA (alpha/beta hydrolase family)
MKRIDPLGYIISDFMLSFSYELSKQAAIQQMERSENPYWDGPMVNLRWQTVGAIDSMFNMGPKLRDSVDNFFVDSDK